jgi:SAM-dependent methyltransferase
VKILDLGCGKKKRAGAISVDYSDRHNPDVVHDLNIFPYPFQDDEFEEISLDNVLEHLNDPMKVMEDVHRICAPGARVKVVVPYFRSVWAFIDPTHKHFFTVDSFSYFDPRHIICKRFDYTAARFLIQTIVFNETFESRWPKKLLIKLANRYPNRYEYYFRHLYPLDEITYFLKKC